MNDEYIKEIVYSYEDHDYAMYLSGEYVGSKPTYHDGEVYLDMLALELISFAAGWNSAVEVCQ